MATADIVQIEDNSHISKSFKELHSLWQSEQLCDLTIKVSETEFKVHKLILASSCQYFKHMFTKEIFTENTSNYVQLNQIDVEAFRIIVEYFYSGYVCLSESTIERVLRTADFFVLPALKSICREYLLKYIDINNCVKRYSLGVSYEFDDLKNEAKCFIIEKLNEVSKTPEFLEINKGTLVELLTKQTYKAESIYNAINEWMKYDLYNRKCHMTDLLLALISPENITYDFYVDNMKSDEILREDSKCLKWMLDNFLNKFAKLSVAASRQESNLFIVSQQTDESQCFQFKLENNELVPLVPRPQIGRFCTNSYKDSIYLTAGAYDDKNVQKSYKYDSCKNSWMEINLNCERYDAGSCTLNDQLFIAGGYDIETSLELKSCICYCLNSEYKFFFAEMNQSRQTPGLCVYKNSIYACCGYYEETDVDLFSIERYDPREGVWYEAGKYRSVSGRCSSVVMLDCMYTSGEESGILERFDFRNNNSEELCKKNKISFNCITSARDKLFRVQRTTLSEYDVENNQWLKKNSDFNLSWPVVTLWDTT